MRKHNLFKRLISAVICLALVLGYDLLGISQVTALIIAFLITAVWWIVCGIPLARSYRQKVYQSGGGNPVAATFRQLGRTFREVQKQKHKKEKPITECCINLIIADIKVY